MPYYAEKLSGARLKRVYDIATPRVRQYLEAEIEHVLKHIQPGDRVLDLGCGYGRIIPRLSGKAGEVVGIDSSIDSLIFGKTLLEDVPNYRLICMDAVALGLADDSFDAVICIQNGVSAFHVDKTHLINESIRICKSDGTVLYSSYSESFWDHRLKWFEIQASKGLLGEIDQEKTGNGIITCKDGFTASIVGSDEFKSLTMNINGEISIEEVDNSSLFCRIIPIK